MENNEILLDSQNDFSNMQNTLNEISYKMDSLVFHQEEQTGAISQGFGLIIVFAIVVIIYTFIKSFIDF